MSLGSWSTFQITFVMDAYRLSNNDTATVNIDANQFKQYLVLLHHYCACALYSGCGNFKTMDEKRSRINCSSVNAIKKIEEAVISSVSSVIDKNIIWDDSENERVREHFKDVIFHHVLFSLVTLDLMIVSNTNNLRTK